MLDSIIRFLKRLKLKIQCKCGCLGKCEVDINRQPSVVHPIEEHARAPHQSPVQSPMLHRAPIPTPNEYVVID